MVNLVQQLAKMRLRISKVKLRQELQNNKSMNSKLLLVLLHVAVAKMIHAIY